MLPSWTRLHAPNGDEPCVLALCDAVAEQEADAALALEHWEELQQVAEPEAGGRDASAVVPSSGRATALCRRWPCA